MDAGISEAALARWVRERFGAGVGIRAVAPLGGEAGEKGFGYGKPLRISLDAGPIREVVLHPSVPDGFGHDTLADRAAEALLPWDTFGNLPGHVRALDVGYFAADGSLASLAGARDFWVATEFGEGEPYFRDLERLEHADGAGERDVARAELLAAALARIHADRHDAPELYRRRIRDLFGGHECIAGMIDSYADVDLDGWASPAFFLDLERRLVPWRFRLRGETARLCRVHGDFHPWNILFADDDRPTFLDRSRGEWGEAADDVACLSVNYLFFSLRAHGRLAGAYADLWSRFFQRYHEETEDPLLLELVAPFFAFRCLVLASPLWYPHLAPDVRAALLRFASRAIDLPRFDPHGVNELLGAGSP
jgi:hypothetical protein